ncbi:UPF0193 protein EVG1 homolog [Amphibalanus amphitrite]|uniref:UPF0193 protein EVG1 homolog n=1 Tax=Amphibalanus amphitrite TaxID=1232801 RepID=UPI001C91B8E5|nr:UPF0193 protein EVG1 homolog [Amphibalanus amphitrite]XP_043238708.1 UPF0193 protein EVG1 homolog [Amphibalanus amphitrite]
MAGPPPRSIDAGIFNVARPSYSASTLQLVKLLMEETRVPKQQQRLFEQSLRSGQPLPAPARRGPRGGRRPVAVSVCKTDNGGGRRTRDTITRLENEHGSPPAYRPRPGRDRDAERERLAYVMTHGRQQPGEDMSPSEEPERTPPQEDRFEELWQEVEERRQFLAEMRQLGRGEQYEPIIRGEVARLVQEMEELQKQEANGDGQQGRGSGNE